MAKANKKATAKKSAKPAARPRARHASAAAPVPAARVRMYRHGLGDCFLLAFPKPAGGDYFVLIDCGVILGTPNAGKLMTAVADDILAETRGRLDVLVVTHEHWDHVSGFVQAREVFDRLVIGQVWFAWTEDPADETAERLRQDRAHRLAALWLGLGQMRARLATAGSKEDAEAVGRAAEVLSFFGVDPEESPPAGGLAAAAATNKTEAAMRWARERTADPKYWRPGDVVDLADAGGVRVYVLGPPTNLRQLFKDMPTKSGRETYEVADGHEVAAARSYFGAAFAAGEVGNGGPEFDRSVPFDPKYQIPPSQAADMAFFQDHYLGQGEADEWRKVESEWMAGAAEFALKLDSDTNNTSLALAFELPDGRVLLFPADAQVGNWESWHETGDGAKREWVRGGKKVTAEQLLKRTVLYKVGHHGSHNATLRDRGLEMMIDPDLVAFMPVDTYVARTLKRWTRMPFDPLVARLQTATNGRLVSGDEPLDDPASQGEQVRDASATIEVVGRGGATLTRPLYVEYSLLLSTR